MLSAPRAVAMPPLWCKSCRRKLDQQMETLAIEVDTEEKKKAKDMVTKEGEMSNPTAEEN